jgi:hypothetical protein
MPVKIFSGETADAAGLEARVNEWMAKIEPGSVRQITSATTPAGAQHVVITIWYTEAKDAN